MGHSTGLGTGLGAAIADRRPLLVCGARGSGKTTLLRHLSTNIAMRTTIIDPTSVSHHPGSGRLVVRPNDHEHDATFLDAAAEAILAALEGEPGLLLIDGLELLAPSEDRLSGQRARLNAIVRETLARAAWENLLVFVASATAPAADLLRHFGVRLLMGEPDPASWTALTDQHPCPPAAPPPAEPLAGIHYGWLLSGPTAERILVRSGPD